MTKLTSKQIVDLSREYTFFSWSIQSQVNPIPVGKAEGVYFWDTDGNRYLDFSSQLMNTNIGHQHPKVVKAIQDQAAQICFVHPGNTTEVRALLGKKLAEVTPGNLKKTFFALGGSEANENAIKLARFYTGRHKILAHYRSYHGATHGSIALTGDYRRLAVEPAMPGAVHFLNPFCYRCPFGQKPDSCQRECVSHLEEVIQYEGPDKIAAIIMEGVVGSNGLLVPPADYWPRVREICDKYGILLIADEVMSGWGRTGQWFAVDNWKVVPDIITTAKGITSGYMPLGAVIVSDKIAEFFDDKYLYAGLTYNGHALALAAALATIQVYEDEKLIENSRTLGVYLAQRLAALKEKHPAVGDVRAIGLFSTLELVQNRASKQIMLASVMGEVSKFLRQNGLFTFIMANKMGSMLFIVPPLCITKEQLDEGLAIVDKALEIADEKVDGRE
ncbi:MAG: aspartate aminotransferase family protein [Anaerolineae bacterium CG_4_9_14_3_um_filter_57_17]|nr:aminotransferase class III-fold pyridoxal phosphate-dependent enzyme [bacterium]NCT20547.1 aminotransferase class III-fold pyridoxal phosphate-dependent enzyme [bacterium]OIO86336.1 MAG: aspartate aminotransferase family protein [Anaerolineae bacterium CG2_30_57_67]PJB64846.1 MAG: aspartate aminotransferase family protein [Anaerolineae bacterium CG_4_9_14_3_um_filter_57_17]